MPVENDFLIVAGGSGANVIDQADYSTSGQVNGGYASGVVLSEYFNKSLRQGTTAGAMFAGFIVNVLNQAVVDNGNAGLATLISQFTAAIQNLAAGASSPKVVTVTYSTALVFSAGSANPLIAVFSITLTGNVTSASLTGAAHGQIITFIIKQDSTGGHTFPGTVSGVFNFPAVDTRPSHATVVSFVVDETGNTVPFSPLMSQFGG